MSNDLAVVDMAPLLKILDDAQHHAGAEAPIKKISAWI